MLTTNQINVTIKAKCMKQTIISSIVRLRWLNFIAFFFKFPNAKICQDSFVVFNIFANCDFIRCIFFHLLVNCCCRVNSATILFVGDIRNVWVERPFVLSKNKRGSRAVLVGFVLYSSWLFSEWLKSTRIGKPCAMNWKLRSEDVF